MAILINARLNNMLDLNLYEFTVVWGTYSISCIACIGLGYAWGILTKIKKEVNTNGRTAQELLDES